ncbi:hypothetical protein BHE74_00002352 [Ensete ventricosum]|nr:hypothetical protein BHE74_00002352 [Ensete ventricosum]
MMGEPEDERLRTVDCLRGRLLAERVASKAAKEEAESLAKRECWFGEKGTPPFLYSSSISLSLYRSDAEPETAIHQAESEDRMLAIVPASVQLNLEACRPEVKEVQGVLDALRNIKVQLLYAMGVLVSHGNSRGAAFCCQRNQVKMPVAVKEWYNAR